MTKDERQQIFAEKFRHSADHGSKRNGSGCQVAVTGFGKTYGCLKYIVTPFLQKNQKGYVTILVARESHAKQWQLEVNKILPNLDERSRIKIYTVQLLIKNGYVIGTDFLIVDELHLFYGDEFWEYCNGNKIKFQFNLGLTATYKDQRGRHRKALELYYPIDVITQKEALSEGWISKFMEYNLAVEMTPKEIEEYGGYQDVLSKYLPKFQQFGTKLAYLCVRGGISTQGITKSAATWCKEYAASLGWTPTMLPTEEIYKQWNPKTIQNYARQVVNTNKAMNDFLYYNSSKFETVIEILRKFSNRKIMTFGQSAKFADDVCEFFNEKQMGTGVVFHTQMESRPLKNEHGEWILVKSGAKKGEKRLFGIKHLKDTALADFMSNKANLMCTVSALDANLNCPDIEIGIITARTNNPNQQLQRGGRIKRILPKDSNAIMIIINIFNSNTKDYEWLRNAQQDNEHYVKWITSVEDIAFTVETEETFNLSEL